MFWVVDGLAEKLKMGGRRFAAARRPAKKAHVVEAKSRIFRTYAVFHRCSGILFKMTAHGHGGRVIRVVAYFVRSSKTGVICKSASAAGSFSKRKKSGS